LSKREADMRKLIRSIRKLLQRVVRENFIYMMFFATVFFLVFITTNISGLSIDKYQDWTYNERMIYVNGIIDGLKTAEIISFDHMSGRELWKPISIFRLYYNRRDYESIAKIMADNLCYGDYELEHDMPQRIVREVRRIYGGS